MWLAIFWGGVAGSAVLVGALFGIYFKLPSKLIALIMAYGTGILIGAASFELLLDAIENGGRTATVVGFISGATLFTAFEFIIAKKGGHHRKRSSSNPVGHSGLAIFVGTILDAIPESVILGVSLLKDGSVSWALLAAIFLSNFPEGLSSTHGLKKDGYSNKKIVFLWAFVFLLAAFGSFSGFYFLKDTSEVYIASIGAFAAGGIIAMVSSTMMPEAFEEGGPIVGMIAALGLLTSLMLS
ncbi:ZIP family metal transporter [Bacillus sp. Marseille-P3661]|uniref:ZIP family metal transporter n=1 Tax=Bacillus sp. Marseille-P3661 TaxID=1936234 RepID=UPI000C8565A0|nr:ZIP family metal transporter [Bacillus sp. Marseille-P3661]